MTKLRINPDSLIPILGRDLNKILENGTQDVMAKLRPILRLEESAEKGGFMPEIMLSNPSELSVELSSIIGFAKRFVGYSASRRPKVSFKTLEEINKEGGQRFKVIKSGGVYKSLEGEIIITNKGLLEQKLSLPHEYSHFLIDDLSIATSIGYGKEFSRIGGWHPRMNYGDKIKRVMKFQMPLPMWDANKSAGIKMLTDFRPTKGVYVYEAMNEAAAMLFTAAYITREERLILPFLLGERAHHMKQACIAISGMLNRDLDSAMVAMVMEPKADRKNRTGPKPAPNEEDARLQMRYMAENIPYNIGLAAILAIMKAEQDSRKAFMKITEMIRRGSKFAERRLHDYAWKSFGDAAMEASSEVPPAKV